MASATSFFAHLSMPIVPARMPEPTTGLWVEGAQRCQRPVLTQGAVDCREDHIGSGEEQSAALSPSGSSRCLHRPSRPMVMMLTSNPRLCSANSTAAAVSRETSCSAFYPPPMTKTCSVMRSSFSRGVRCL